MARAGNKPRCKDCGHPRGQRSTNNRTRDGKRRKKAYCGCCHREGASNALRREN